MFNLSTCFSIPRHCSNPLEKNQVAFFATYHDPVTIKCTYMFIVYQYKFQIILEAPTKGRNNVSCTVAAAGHPRYCHRLSTAFRQQDIPPRWRGIRI
jgi:hypothetical protein